MLGFHIHGVRAEEVFWVNDAGGNWSTVANWDTGTLPGEQDAVFITQPGSYIVSLDVSASISSLTVGDGLDAQKLNVGGQSIDISTAALVRANAVLDLNSGSISGDAPITIEGELNWNNGTLAGPSPLTIAAGATLNMPTSFDKHLSRPLDNHGTIEWTGGHFYVGAVTLQNLSDGTFHAAAADRQIIKNADEAQLDNHGTFQVDTTATIRLSSGIPFNNHGVVGGQGLFDITGGQYANTGEYSPGVPFGSLSIRGTVSIEQDKTLVIQLAGTTTGVSYDQLKVLGHATWGGTLAIELADGFRPQAGDAFTVLEFNSNTGFFDRITGLNLGPQLYLVTEFTPTNLILTTVDSRPQPVLSGSRSSTEGAVDFQVTSIAGQDIVLWTTANLTPLPAWAPVLTNYDCGAVFDFIDLAASNISTRFYSVELLPAE